MNNLKNSPDIGAGFGLLIDLTDEEKIPFPSQLMTAGEVDDTFGIFESKQRSVSLDGPSTPVTNNDDCYFKVPIPIATSEKMFCNNNNNNNDDVEERNKRKSIRKSTIGGHQVLAGSASMLGLNDAFIRSTGSDSTTNGDDVTLDSSGQGSSSRSNSISSTLMTSDLNITEKNLDNPDNSIFISPIARDDIGDDKSTKGNTSSDESGLLEVENVSTFTISDSDITTTPPTESTKKSKLGSELDIFDRVFKVSACKRPSNDSIAKKVQELFDAASPSKNPHLYKGSNIRMSMGGSHHFTPGRRPIVATIPKQPESLYATPRRETPRQFTPIQREEHVSETCFHTPLRSSTPPHVSKSRLPARLSFGSTSSSSSGGEGPSTRKLVKATPTMGSSVASITRKIQSTQLAPKLRLAEPQRMYKGSKGPQPLKAMPMHQILPVSGTKNSRDVSSMGSGCASAPVHRKFMAPIASSSPKVDTSFNSYQVGTPTRNKRLSTVRSSGYGQVSHPKVIPESPNLMNTTTTRILPSPSRGIPSPARRTILSQNELSSPSSNRSKVATKIGGGITSTKRPSISTSTKENSPKFGFRRK